MVFRIQYHPQKVIGFLGYMSIWFYLCKQGKQLRWQNGFHLCPSSYDLTLRFATWWCLKHISVDWMTVISMISTCSTCLVFLVLPVSLHFHLSPSWNRKGRRFCAWNLPVSMWQAVGSSLQVSRFQTPTSYRDKWGGQRNHLSFMRHLPWHSYCWWFRNPANQLRLALSWNLCVSYDEKTSLGSSFSKNLAGCLLKVFILKMDPLERLLLGGWLEERAPKFTCWKITCMRENPKCYTTTNPTNKRFSWVKFHMFN